jgi:hypothetical protein
MPGNPKQSKDPFLPINAMKPRTAGLEAMIAMFGRNGVKPGREPSFSWASSGM